MNPNGLTDEQIAARPEIAPGFIGWDVEAGRWFTVRRVNAVGFGVAVIYAPDMPGILHMFDFLLPGEPGCPWPPPKEFRRDWQEGDRAWLLINGEKGRFTWPK